MLIGEILYACPPINGFGSKCKNIIRLTQFEPQGLLCHRGSPFQRRSGGNIAFTTPIISPVWKGTPCRDSCVADFILLMIQSPQCRRQRENGLGASRGTRASKRRMYSSPSLGFAILHNKETSATCPHHETFYSPKRNEHHCSMTLDNCISALVDIFHTDVFAQDEVQDARKDTNTTTSAVMAVHIPLSTATLLTVIRLSLSASLMTTPQPLRQLILRLPSQEPRNSFIFQCYFPYQ